jgi:hypothetical protein
MSNISNLGTNRPLTGSQTQLHIAEMVYWMMLPQTLFTFKAVKRQPWGKISYYLCKKTALSVRAAVCRRMPDRPTVGVDSLIR